MNEQYYQIPGSYKCENVVSEPSVDHCQHQEEEGKEGKETHSEIVIPTSYWGEWKNWTPCSSTCTRGIRVRFRRCRPETVDEKEREELSCLKAEREECGEDSAACRKPLSPGVSTDNIYRDFWQSWGPWSTCSATCGKGERKRERKCKSWRGSSEINAWACTSSHRQNCQAAPCPTRPTASAQRSYLSVGISGLPEKFWQSWQAWTDCSATCGGGVKSRYRSCRLFTVPSTQWGSVPCSDVGQAPCASKSCPDSGLTGSLNPVTIPNTVSNEVILENKRLIAEVLDEVETAVTGIQFCVAECRRRGGRCRAAAYHLASSGASCLLYTQDIGSGGVMVEALPINGEKWILAQFFTTKKVKTWSGWERCSATCGQGTRSRKGAGEGRIGSAMVQFGVSQRESCYLSACSSLPSSTSLQNFLRSLQTQPLQPSFQSQNTGSTRSGKLWGEWSACSATCGPSTRKRKRLVEKRTIDGSIMVLTATQTENCPLLACASPTTARRKF